jgi:hypothetical protein
MRITPGQLDAAITSNFADGWRSEPLQALASVHEFLAADATRRLKRLASFVSRLNHQLIAA